VTIVSLVGIGVIPTELLMLLYTMYVDVGILGVNNSDHNAHWQLVPQIAY